MEALFTPLGFILLSLTFVVSLMTLSRPIFGLAMLPIAAVAVDYASHELVIMAAASTVILVMLILGLVREKSMKIPTTNLRPRSGVDGAFLWLAVVTVVYLVVGIARGNKAVYVIGDTYHILLEICLPFFLFMIYTRRQERFDSFLGSLGTLMMLFSGLVLVLYATGLFQQLPGAGIWYRNMGILRIRYTHNFPLFPMTILLGAWLFATPSPQRRRTGLALLFMLVILLLGLKRVLWISLLLVLLFDFVSVGFRQQLRAIRAAIVTVTVVIVAGMILIPSESFQELAELDPYSEVVQKRFSSKESDITVSVMNRRVQIEDALERAVANPLGYGVGSEFELVSSVREGAPAATHYVHSSYVQYLLQLGVWWLIFLLVVSVKVFRTGFRLFRRLPDGQMKGAVLGAMGCYLSILVTSASEISVNTFFLPFSVGVIFQAENLAREQGLLQPRMGAAAAARARAEATIPGVRARSSEENLG